MGEPQLWDATGNRFLVVDALDGGPEDELVERGRGALDQAFEGGAVPDGALVCAPALGRGACRMVVVNRDGSRAQACGNGLRCVALFALMRGLATPPFTIETDAGPRTARWTGAPGARWEAGSVSVSMGRPRLLAQLDPRQLQVDARAAFAVDLGNPHCVLLVDDPAVEPVAERGAALQRCPHFPQGVNVGFAARRGERHLVLRVFERGVGETAACGTGAVAAVWAWHRRQPLTSPCVVDTPGGPLRVEWRRGEEPLLSGALAPPSTAVGARP